jgi:hypothetical protein
MINIIKKYPLQYKIKCDQCEKEGYINKRYFDKFGWKHKCLEATPSHFVEEIIIESIPLDATPEEIRLDQRHVQTEKIIKKKSKK